MHRSCLGGLIIDCNTDDLDRDADFWSKALGLENRPSDDGSGGEKPVQYHR